MEYSKTPDAQLIKLVKESSDSEAFLEICARVEKLFYRVCHKYSLPLKSHGIDLNDILEQKDAIIYFCVNNFDIKKGSKFSTYVGNYSRFLCLNSINARKFLLPSTDDEIFKVIEESQTYTDYKNRADTHEEYKMLRELINKFQDKRITEIFNHRYLGEKKMVWRDVAKKLGLSSQTVISLNSKGLKLLKSKLKTRNADNFE